MNQLEANPQVTPVGQSFVVSQTVQPGIFWRRTCKCLGFSSYSLVYTTVCTTYNQGMPNRCIFFYLYQIGFYYCETILNSSYIQTFSYNLLPKSLSCVYPEQLDIVQLSGKVLPWGQFSSQPFNMSSMYGVLEHYMFIVHFTILFILLISFL